MMASLGESSFKDDDEDYASDVSNLAADVPQAAGLVWPMFCCALLMVGVLVGTEMSGAPFASACLASTVVGCNLSIIFPEVMLVLTTKALRMHSGLKLLLLFLIWMHELNGALAVTSASFALMVNSSDLPRVWIDSACNQTLFCNKDLLVNVRKIHPRSVGGAQTDSSMICHYQGDYPLVLQDEFGVIHCCMIRNVLVSKDTVHNLLSLHDSVMLMWVFISHQIARSQF
jgi:hypothetical protein